MPVAPRGALPGVRVAAAARRAGLLVAAAAAAAAALGGGGTVAAADPEQLNKALADARDQREMKEFQCRDGSKVAKDLVADAQAALMHAEAEVSGISTKVTKIQGQLQEVQKQIEHVKQRREMTLNICAQVETVSKTGRENIQEVEREWDEIMPPVASNPRLRARYTKLAGAYEDQKLWSDKGTIQRKAACKARLDGLDAEATNAQDDLFNILADQQELMRQRQQKERNQVVAQQEFEDAQATLKHREEECRSDKAAFEAMEEKLREQRTKALQRAGGSGVVSDCEVSPFQAAEPCSKTCGKGARRIVREVIRHAEGGAPCPKLEAEIDCNEEPCPIDCKLGMWNEWSACSVTCGGGLSTRTREVVRQGRFGGKPCGGQSGQQKCGNDKCHEGCKLGEWSGWGFCTKACGGGQRARQRAVVAPAKGLGTCPTEASPKRLQFGKCPSKPCPLKPGDPGTGAAKLAEEALGKNASAILGLGGPPQHGLTCGAKADFAILIDSSPLLSGREFDDERAFAAELLERLLAAREGNSTEGQAGLVLFSPGVGGGTAETWTAPLSADPKALSGWLDKRARGAGAASAAEGLGAARQLLGRGREGVPNTVLILIQGRPNSVQTAKVASRRLQQLGARVVVMATTPSVGIPREGVRASLRLLASPPADENLFVADSFGELRRTLRRRVVDVCPALPPAQRLPGSYLPAPPASSAAKGTAADSEDEKAEQQADVEKAKAAEADVADADEEADEAEAEDEG